MERAQDLTHSEIASFVGHASPLILEIGANDGADTAQFLEHFQGRPLIYCFECDPRAIDKFRVRNFSPERVILTEIALASKSGTHEFYQSGGTPTMDRSIDWDKSGSLFRPTGHLVYSPWCKFDSKIEVPTITLDEWAEENIPNEPIIDFIWIDTQGAELDIFRGGLHTLAKTRFVKTECHRTIMYEGAPTEGDLRGFFYEWTYIGRYADDLLFRNDAV